MHYTGQSYCAACSPSERPLIRLTDLTKKIWQSFRADISRGNVVVLAVAEMILPMHEAVEGVVVGVVPVRVLQVRRHAFPECGLLELN